MHKFSRVTLFIIVALVFSLLSVIAQDENGDGFADHINVGSTSGTQTLDPHGLAFYQLSQVYDTLIEWSDEGELVGELAESWEFIDPTTLEVRLREGVEFSNGEALTAETIAFNFERLNTSENPLHATTQQRMNIFPSQGFGYTTEVVDDLTIRITPPFPDPVLDRRLTQMYIVPEGLTTENEGDLTSVSAGTGPFIITNFDPGQRVDYEAWDDNWRGAPTVRTASYITIPDSSTLISALQTGEIDIALGIPPDQARRLEDGGEFAVTAVPAGGIELVSFVPDVEPLLNDPDVRLALNLAINKEEYNEIILGGYGIVPDGQFMQPGFEGYNPDLEGYGYDPERAMELLAEAGADNLQLTIATTFANQSRVEAVAGYLQSVGVNAQVEIQDFSAFIGTVLRGSEVPALLWTPYYTRLGGWAELVRYQPPPPGVPLQSFFPNEEFAELSQQVAMTFEQEERDTLVQQMMTIAHDDVAALWLSYPYIIWVHNPAITDPPVGYESALRMWEIERPVD